MSIKNVDFSVCIVFNIFDHFEWMMYLSFCVLGFSLILIYSVPFSLSSSLGAGSVKQTRKPLGAHQERILIAMKENTAVAIYNRITFPVLEIRHH